MKHGWMRSWASISAALFVCSLVSGQTPSAAHRAAKPRRVNEFTLAGLRPGFDRASRAIRKFKLPRATKEGPAVLAWEDDCRAESLFLDVDQNERIQSIRVTAKAKSLKSSCGIVTRSHWSTGHDLALRDAAVRVTKLYGPPDSRSPSTKDGQQLELLYYAFDWAGSNVPQVMEVLCTKEKDGKPGQVIEITLAAASL